MDIKRNNARFASFVKRMTRQLGIPLQSINRSQSWGNLKITALRIKEDKEEENLIETAI